MLQVLKEHISHMKAAEPYLTNAKPSCKVTAVLTVPHTVAEIQAVMQKFHVGCLIQNLLLVCFTLLGLQLLDNRLENRSVTFLGFIHHVKKSVFTFIRW